MSHRRSRGREYRRSGVPGSLDTVQQFFSMIIARLGELDSGEILANVSCRDGMAKAEFAIKNLILNVNLKQTQL